jgi:hypothetical protein
MKPSFCAERLWPAGVGGGGFYAQSAEMAAAIVFLDDFGEFFTFCLTVESSLDKYMRICLCRDVWW